MKWTSKKSKVQPRKNQTSARTNFKTFSWTKKITKSYIIKFTMLMTFKKTARIRPNPWKFRLLYKVYGAVFAFKKWWNFFKKKIEIFFRFFFVENHPPHDILRTKWYIFRISQSIKQTKRIHIHKRTKLNPLPRRLKYLLHSIARNNISRAKWSQIGQNGNL